MVRIPAFLLGITVAACSGGPPRSLPPQATSQVTPAPAPADQLVDRMLRALEAEDVLAWRELLSAQMRARFGSDPGALHEHLMGWRRDVLPLAQTLRHAELAIDATGPEPVVTYAADGRDAIALASVVVEGGALHLDEN
ncbi:MAG: hypothetical protein IPQ07_13915 [Myxococcales bacterium]|nr:hypothetical protein [Myxococcales bacterium]